VALAGNNMTCSVYRDEPLTAMPALFRATPSGLAVAWSFGLTRQPAGDICSASRGEEMLPWHRSAFAAAVVAAMVASIPVQQARAAETLTNPTTRVRVRGGDANNGTISSPGYFDYMDLATSERTTFSIRF
jgi:hypothetical protein